MATILVVDDDSVDREAAARCLAAVEGLEVREACDGAGALASIAAGPPDLVLTDLRMPGMDGLQLVQRLRDERPLMPVILMTSQGSERVAVSALKAGAASYVPKSHLAEMLPDTVGQLLEVVEAGRSRGEALRYLEICETRFALANDPSLVFPVASYLQEDLQRVGFADDSTRAQVAMALAEAIFNAMIHGNLEVGSGLRRSDRAGFDALVERRRREHPYADRRVLCTARESAERIEYVIKDEGPGFDPSVLPDPRAPENILSVSGRGLLLMRTFMDDVRYNDRGNQVTLSKAGPEAARRAS